MNTVALVDWVIDARRRTLELYADLDEARYEVPRLRIINPPGWELGHVAWFAEHWVLQTALTQPPLHAGNAALFDSTVVPHADRWSLPLPSRAATREYLEEVRDRVLAAFASADPTQIPRLSYFTMLSVFHEDMHGEAFAYTRQTLGYGPPPVTPVPAHASDAEKGALPGDAAVPGGRFRLGAEPAPKPLFVFDNEKWAHEQEVNPFRIARAAVTQSEFAAFVEDGGYLRRALWTPSGWAWREQAGAAHPVYWRRGGAGWERRSWDRFVPLEPHRPVLHVNAYEAEAFCEWAGRRLPTELEWEVAAASEPDESGRALSAHKRPYPWGDAAVSPECANLDMRLGGTLDVAALPKGDSAFGCRQMWGNVWEWTATPFGPYPGFVRDPYKEYSEPWFGTHRVLRGGCFVTRARLLRNTWRNFYPSDRRDVWAGFRTCAR